MMPGKVQRDAAGGPTPFLSEDLAEESLILSGELDSCLKEGMGLDQYPDWPQLLCRSLVRYVLRAARPRCALHPHQYPTT